jgi:hypothetical protein
MDKTTTKRGILLTVMIALLTLGTLAAAPSEIYHWHQYYPWWWTVNAVGVYSISLIGLYGAWRLRKWGFWLSVGSTIAAPLYLRPNDHTLQTVQGAIIYVALTGGLIGLYWYAILRNWRNFK